VTARRPPVLRPGEWVHYDGGEHQVVALSGTSVRFTGLPPDAGPDARPRPEYDPATRTLAQLDAAKAAELAAAGRKVSARTVERMRARYARQRLWGLVDRRLIPGGGEATGRADARLVAAVQEQIAAETNTSTGTRPRLIREVVQWLEEQYGPGVVPLPARPRSTSWSGRCRPAAHVRLGGHPPAGGQPAHRHVHPDMRRPAR
jgi:hypothetical protein